MKKYRNVFLGVFLLMGAIGMSDADEQFLPPTGKTFVFIGQDNNTNMQYVRAVNHQPSGFMLYTSVQEMGGLYEEKNHGAGPHHAQELAAQFPQARFQIGLYMVDALEGVVQGQYDANIQKLGEWLMGSKRPVYLRIGYEFDLPDNHYSPEEFKKAFRYIVDHLRAQGVENTAYVWHSYGYLNLDKPMMDWYPGDDYVDFFGVSLFKPFNNGNMNFIRNRAKEHGKPFMIAEATPLGIGTIAGEKSWNVWFKPFFQYINDHDVPIVSYINSEWETMPMFKGQGWGDARIQANDVVKERWLKELKNDRYQIPDDKNKDRGLTEGARTLE